MRLIVFFLFLIEIFRVESNKHTVALNNASNLLIKILTNYNRMENDGLNTRSLSSEDNFVAMQQIQFAENLYLMINNAKSLVYSENVSKKKKNRAIYLLKKAVSYIENDEIKIKELKVKEVERKNKNADKMKKLADRISKLMGE